MQTEKQLNNLKPFTKENAKEKGQKGGIASGIARNEKKDYLALLRDLAHQQITNEEAKKELIKNGLDTDIRNYIFYKIFMEATEKDNYKAQQKLFDSFLMADNNPFEIRI